jgi:hypothetical protein
MFQLITLLHVSVPTDLEIIVVVVTEHLPLLFVVIHNRMHTMKKGILNRTALCSSLI